jgi:DNA/RNA endonuclease YhcR with UshA esterase domain
MEQIKIWSLDNEKAVLIINGEVIKGEVEYFRGKPTVKAENGNRYSV